VELGTTRRFSHRRRHASKKKKYGIFILQRRHNMANKEKIISFRISEEEYHQLKKIAEKKDISMSDILSDLIDDYIVQNKILLRDAKPLFNEVEWIAINEFKNNLPELYVNVVNFTASIWYKGQDITDQIPNGEELAKEAAFVAGGGINRSGIYPPTDVILEEVQKLEEGV
jgi:hypothetical protein